MRRRPAVLASGVLLAIATLVASCDDQSAPPSSAATSRSTQSAATLAPIEQWRFDAPDRYYVRVAASDRVVLAAAAPDFPQFHPEERFVVALERDSGAVRWRVPLPCAPLFPAVDGERAYLPCNDGLIRAWNLVDGSEAWSIDTEAAPVFIIPAGALLFVADGDPDDGYGLTGVDPPRRPDGRVRAYDAATGSLQWELLTKRENAHLTLGAQALYVSTQDRSASGETLALNPATGEVLWRAATGPASSRPFATPDAVFATGAGGIHRLSAHDGKEEWTRSVPGGGVFQAPVAAGGVIVAGTNVRVIYGLNAADGAISGQSRYCDCPYDAVALEDHVLVMGAGIALLDPGGLRLAWAYPGAAFPSELGVDGAVVADGWFFTPAGRTLLAFRHH